MALTDYFVFDNPNVLAFVVGILAFVILFSVLKRFFRQGEKGIIIIISVVVAAIVSWRLYSEKFYGWESAFVVVIYVLFAAVLLKVFWGFLKGSKRRIIH